MAILIRQNRKEQLRAVQWRQGNEIEDGQYDIDDDYISDDLKERIADIGGGGGEAHDSTKDEGYQEIGSRTCQSDEEFALAAIFQIIRIVRHGFGPAEGETKERSDERHEDGADGVYMFDRIQGQSAG